MGESIRLLDDTILGRLKSQIPPKALQLLNKIMNDHEVRFMNYQDNPNRAATAYTEIVGGIYYMWLNPDEDEIADTFVHEIGQIYTYILGYQKEAKPKLSGRRQDDIAKALAEWTVNAFRGAITERNLEKYGIDRSHYRRRRYEAFKELLNNIPNMNAIEKDEMSRLLERTRLCYHYNLTRLILMKEFGDLEQLWNEKISYDAIKKAAVQIFVVASNKELMPSRYVEVQKYFIKTLRLKDYVTMQLH
jgi:hypothetical protein